MKIIFRNIKTNFGNIKMILKIEISPFFAPPLSSISKNFKMVLYRQNNPNFVFITKIDAPQPKSCSCIIVYCTHLEDCFITLVFDEPCFFIRWLLISSFVSKISSHIPHLYFQFPIWDCFTCVSYSVQVIFCEKHSFLHQLTKNMTKYVSWITVSVQENYKLCTLKCVFWGFFDIQNNLMYTTCTELVVVLHWINNSTNNLLSYFGLVDAKNEGFLQRITCIRLESLDTLSTLICVKWTSTFDMFSYQFNF